MLKPDDRSDEKAESPLGRMLLKGALGTELVGKLRQASDRARLRYDAGTMFAQIVGAYRATIEGPRGTAGSGRGTGCIAERYGQEDACRWDPDSCSCLRRRNRYTSAHDAIMEDAGRAAMRAVGRVCVHGQAIRDEELINLLDGLDVLIRHLGLTPRRGLPHS